MAASGPACETSTSYAALTRDDPSPIKRWLQQRRLADALRFLPPDLRPSLVVDYGAGDGELTRGLARRFPTAEVVCFEPAPFLLAQAAERLSALARVRFAQDEGELPRGRADLVVCTEVFEHLPPPQFRRALETIAALLSPTGVALIGVPVETGVPALAKGLFRMGRPARPGLRSVVLAVAGRAGELRSVAEIVPGRPYFYEHVGFDHRSAERELRAHLQVIGRRGSPLPLAPADLNSELYLLARRRARPEPGRDLTPAAAPRSPAL